MNTVNYRRVTDNHRGMAHVVQRKAAIWGRGNRFPCLSECNRKLLRDGFARPSSAIFAKPNPDAVAGCTKPWRVGKQKPNRAARRHYAGA